MKVLPECRQCAEGHCSEDWQPVVGREAGPHPAWGQRNAAKSTHAAEHIAAAA